MDKEKIILLIVGAIIGFVVSLAKDWLMEGKKQKEKEKEFRKVNLEKIYLISKKMYDFQVSKTEFMINIDYADPNEIEMLIHLYFRKELLKDYNIFMHEYIKVLDYKKNKQEYDSTKILDAFENFRNNLIKVSKET